MDIGSSDGPVVAMAFEFQPDEGYVSGWVAADSAPLSRANVVMGAIGPLLYCAVILPSATSAPGVLDLRENLPMLEGNDSSFPEEGDSYDSRFSGGMRWNPVLPNSISCETEELTRYILTRHEGPLDLGDLEVAMRRIGEQMDTTADIGAE